MLSGRNLIFEAKDVPETWVFSNYCGVPLDQFNGNEFKIKSVFTDERTPSMGFFLKEGKYLFNDFSSGHKGDCLTLVKLLHGLDFHQTCNKIVDDYNHWRRTIGGDTPIPSFYTQLKSRVTGHVQRSWTVSDSQYWLPYNIGTSLLRRFNVRPLSSFTMEKGDQPITIAGDRIFGYFTNAGDLYKIYQPESDQAKFIKVRDYIQGSEQISNLPYLIYCSSLKDLMSLHSLRLNVDSKAPDSENTMLPASIVDQDLLQYRRVLSLFDIDAAGQAAAGKYQDKYGIQPVYLAYGEKDLSDHIKRFGPAKVKNWLVPLMDRKLCA